MDGTSDGAEEAEALFQVPDAGTGERILVQRVRVQAEALGIGAQFEPDGTTSQNLVPESAHEEQEEQPASTGWKPQRCSSQRRRWWRRRVGTARCQWQSGSQRLLGKMNRSI